ncbi:MAG TPA: hypothetical protein PLI43_00155 [Albidovulum sp.]|uniref:hypothetical protein n=1 Tax=Albidovulum sp. TaxID=1872424 RepID=UPI002C242A43|nr:hypothetical protein [Albidovulum sp.]
MEFRNLECLALLALATPALAAAPDATLMTCDFAGEKVSVVGTPDKAQIKVGDLYYRALITNPGAESRIGAVFAMLDAGPLMIAVDAKATSGERRAEITATGRGADGIASRSTAGICRETTP